MLDKQNNMPWSPRTRTNCKFGLELCKWRIDRGLTIGNSTQRCLEEYKQVWNSKRSLYALQPSSWDKFVPLFCFDHQWRTTTVAQPVQTWYISCISLLICLHSNRRRPGLRLDRRVIHVLNWKYNSTQRVTPVRSRCVPYSVCCVQ